MQLFEARMGCLRLLNTDEKMTLLTTNIAFVASTLQQVCAAVCFSFILPLSRCWEHRGELPFNPI